MQTKHYVLAQFSRHIRPGMRIIPTTVSHTIAAYDPAARRLVIVAAYSGTAQTLTFGLSLFSQVTDGAGGLVPRWSTHTSGGSDRYTHRADTYLSGKSVSVPFATGQVQTLEIDGVVDEPTMT